MNEVSDEPLSEAAYCEYAGLDPKELKVERLAHPNLISPGFAHWQPQFLLVGRPKGWRAATFTHDGGRGAICLNPNECQLEHRVIVFR